MRNVRLLPTLILSSAMVTTAVTGSALAGNPAMGAAQGGAAPAAVSGDDVSVSAMLTDRDPVDGQGHHVRTREIRLNAGEQVDIAVASSTFDTVLRVTGHGANEENDDAEGEGTNSRVRFVAPASGIYTVSVTSYNAGETGDYQLTVQHGGEGHGAAPTTPEVDPTVAPVPTVSAEMVAPPTWRWDAASNRFAQVDPSESAAATPTAPDAPADPNQRTGSVYGVFVGVSDYGGSNNLDDTANDARNLEQAFERSGVMRPGDGVVLTDANANAMQVRQAFQTLAQRVTSRDTFVFFFDGHGASNEIELASGGMSASELSSMLDGVHGQQLVVLDSCNSGSFTSAIQGRTNRVGLFSSRASETSYVANEVNAGGWLAYFMIQAVQTGVHGAADGALHVADLSAYVLRGYAQRVGGRQHLVVASGESRQATLWHTGVRNSLAVNP